MIYLRIFCIFWLIICFSVKLTLSQSPNINEQRALTNICETAMRTDDTMTVQHVAQRIMDWSGIEDPQIIESAITCLSIHYEKKVVYSLEEGFQFSNAPQKQISDPYNQTKSLWQKFIFENRIGDAEDYFLQKRLSVGWENVIVIMGYENDWDACQQVKNLFTFGSNLAEYRCVPANQPPS